MPTHHWLDVPGARLYYEVQGSGPVLMLIGHPMDNSGFAGIAPLLANDYTVVTYDPRGFGNSTIDDPNQDAEPDVIADEIRRVLEVVGGGPAHVFGSSGGAVTGLALATRYPTVVRTLIAHEPPLALVLPDAEEAERGNQAIYDTYRNEGIGAAWQRFAAFTGIAMRPQGATPPDSAAQARAVATGERFFAHSLLPITLYKPDLAVLRKPSPRIVIAAGAASEGQYPHRTAAALAGLLGTAPIIFPGGHGGFGTDPEEFAAILRGVLADRAPVAR